MISSKDKKILLEIAEKYNVTKLYLFGSNLETTEANDIDLAVEGVSDSEYYKFHGELILNLSKPVDLIDLKKKTIFNEAIESDGLLIYG